MEHVARTLNKDPVAIKTLNFYKQGQVGIPEIWIFGVLYLHKESEERIDKCMYPRMGKYSLLGHI